MNPLVALTSAVLMAASSTPTERFGLFVGSNDGGPGRIRLRYASSDAQQVAKLLGQLGGVPSTHSAVLVDPVRADFEAQIARLERDIAAARAAGARAELVLYFSGHADETGLLLGRDRIDYTELRRMLEEVPAQVRVAILDSCHAGAIIRTKGGRHVPAFLVDASTTVHGQAFLTASSANEAAQESDRIRGSYFTSSLLTGLRGAADATRDGKVTLTEAYQFAFHETLAKTEKTSAGPQHPAYDFHLAGTGDLVMTDVRATSAGLCFGPEIAGRLFVRDAQGRLVAELQKAAGHPVELGLEPGGYGLTLESADGVFEARAELAEGLRVPLSQERFAPATIEVASSRGASGERHLQPVNLAVIPGLSLADFRNGGELPVSIFGLNLIGGRLRAVRGFELGSVFNIETEEAVGLQIAGAANHVGGPVGGVQIAGAWNHGASLSGLQVSGAANHVGGEVKGVQLGGAYNRGLWLGGLQVAGGANLVSETARGLQIAGALNLAGELAGVQLAGVNLARASWMQVGGINHSGSSGLQIGGVNNGGAAAQVGGINRATTTGFQLGGINLAGESGVSIGAINVARRAKAPIGLLNFIEEGYHAVGLWGGDLSGATLGVKLGGELTYTALGLGLRPKMDGYTTTAALGLHLVSGRFFLDTDLGSTAFQDRKSGLWTESRHAIGATWRLAGGFRLWKDLSVVAGPTLNVVTSWGAQDVDLALLPQKVWRNGETTVRLFPGFTLGLQI